LKMKWEELEKWCSKEAWDDSLQPHYDKTTTSQRVPGPYLMATDHCAIIKVQYGSVEGVAEKSVCRVGNPKLLQKVHECFYDALNDADEPWIEWPQEEYIVRKCKACEGSGKVKSYVDCDHCKGEGYLNWECPCCPETIHEECHECNGEGETRSGPLIDCEDCDGSGIFTLSMMLHYLDGTLVKTDTGCSLRIAGKYWRRIAALPEVRFKRPQKRAIVYFRFAYGMGVVGVCDQLFNARRIG